jgi:hypothetical protein
MNFEKLTKDQLNYAIESSAYLDQLSIETDPENRYQLIKKYFTEKITKSLYQHMDLLQSSTISGEKLKSIYELIKKDLNMNITMAINVLSSERKMEDEPDNEYSICQSYCRK